MIKELSSDEARKLLDACELARLGCIVDGEPYVVPVNYYVEDECAYVHSLPGRKVDALRESPRACLQADDIKNEVAWRSVLAYGSYEEIENADERERVLESFKKRFPLLTPVESVSARAGEASPEVVVFRIRLDRIDGIEEG